MLLAGGLDFIRISLLVAAVSLLRQFRLEPEPTSPSASNVASYEADPDSFKTDIALSGLPAPNAFGVENVGLRNRVGSSKSPLGCQDEYAHSVRSRQGSWLPLIQRVLPRTNPETPEMRPCL